MDALGSHLLVDFHGCDTDRLNDETWLRELVLRAVERSGATIRSHDFVTFEPQGVSGVVLVSESHFSLHTWPEHGFLAVDYFTCGACVDQAAAIETLREALAPARVVEHRVPRGPGVGEPGRDLPIARPAADPR